VRIRWTTRIAVAVGLITMIAGIFAGRCSASAAQSGPHSAGAFTARVAAAHP
jgi:hypothetical protein